MYSNIALLLPMKSTAGMGNFRDRSRNVHYVSVVGQVTLSTARSKFYGASALFGGSGDYLRIDTICAELAQVSAFTLEGWFYPTARVGSQPTLFALNTLTGGNRFVVSDYFIYGSHGSGNIMYPGGALPLNQWTHFAVVRSSTQVRVYINGALAISAAATANDTLSSDRLVLGAEYDTNTSVGDYFTGNMQDICITKGEKYTEDFTPPESLFTEVSGTIVDLQGNPVSTTVGLLARESLHIIGGSTSNISGEFLVEGLRNDESVVVFTAPIPESAEDLLYRVTPPAVLNAAWEETSTTLVPIVEGRLLYLSGNKLKALPVASP